MCVCVYLIDFLIDYKKLTFKWYYKNILDYLPKENMKLHS